MKAKQGQAYYVLELQKMKGGVEKKKVLSAIKQKKQVVFRMMDLSGHGCLCRQRFKCMHGVTR